MPSRLRALLAIAALVAFSGACSDTGPSQEQQAGVATAAHPDEIERELLSDTFRVNRIYKSMMGPLTQRPISLEEGEPELLWLTGYAMDVVGADGKSPESVEFECHTNLSWPRSRTEGFHRPSIRAFTLTQGQTDVRLPLGFGLPVLSNETLGFNSQALNLGRPTMDQKIHHRAKVRYVRDADLEVPMKPLVLTHGMVMASLEAQDIVFNVDTPDEHLAGASCSAGEYPKGAKSGTYVDKHKRRFTGHWVVKPGRHEWRTLVTDMLNIPYDTTVHFIGVHVHPYSVSLELRDLTTGESVWKSDHRTSSERVGLEWTDYYSSVEGLPLYADHQYEMISIYDNPSDVDSDAMATLFVYYLDKEFEKPDQVQAQSDSPPHGDEG
jgi:hypothetical protein